MDLRKSIYSAQLKTPEGRQQCVIQFQGGRCTMTRAEMAATRGVEFKYQGTPPGGLPMYKALNPDSSGRSMKKSAGRGLDAPASFGEQLEAMFLLGNQNISQF